MDDPSQIPKWYLLSIGGKKEGPYTLEHLLEIQPTHQRVRRVDDSRWHAWINVNQVYPELAIVNLRTRVPPLLLTENSFINLLLNPDQRQTLLEDIRGERGPRAPLSEHVLRLAPGCKATSDQLRQVIEALRREDSLEALQWILYHPSVPEDLLLELAAQGQCIVALGHRAGPRELLERLAAEHRYSEAITTLALNYYGAEAVPAAEFAKFVQSYRGDFMLRDNLRRTDKLSAEKIRLALDIVGAEEPSPEYESGMTALHFEAYRGNPHGLQAALDKGLDVNARDDSGWTALHWIASMSMVIEEWEHAATTLLRAGAKVDARDSIGQTPLMVACKAGNADLAAQLIAACAHVNARDNAGVTPLVEAVNAGNLEAVSHLLKHGADRAARTQTGETAVEYARTNGWEEIVRLLEH